MDLHLTTSGHERPPFVRIFVNGALTCEYAAGLAEDRDLLAGEVREARALHALAHHVRAWEQGLLGSVAIPDHVHTTPAARQKAFAEGLEAGFTGETVPHGLPGVPPIPPDHSPSYRRGYEHGEALARALALIHEGREGAQS